MKSNRFSTDQGPSQRQRRAGELIRHALAEMLQREEVHDASLPQSPVTITEVRPSPDLKNATVFCSVLGKDDIAGDIAALNTAAPRIRHVLGQKIDLKFTPALVFKADSRFDEAARIDALLNRADVKRDL